MRIGDNHFSARVRDQLAAWFSDGRVPHAVLIDGSDAALREEIALFIAGMMVCRHPDIKPCGVCESCRKVFTSIHPDVICVTRPEDKKFFEKKALKQVVEQAYLLPNEAERKVFILKDMQNMNEECQNVLLKILEEPPEYTAFILTSQSVGNVIGTVRSRVMRLHFESGDAPGEVSPAALGVLKEIAGALSGGTAFDMVKATASLDANKALTAEVLQLLLPFLRDALAAKSGGKALLPEAGAESAALGRYLDSRSLLSLYDKVSELSRATANYPNYTLLATLLAARLSHPDASGKI